jgi:hypothetical protein
MSSWLTILCALLAIHLFALEARAERAKRTGGITLYRAPLGLRMLLGAAIIGMTYGAGTVALSEDFKRDWWVSVSLFGLAVFCASQWPADLGVSKSEIYERKWLGLRKKTFLWKDVASSSLLPDENSVWVVAKSGATIKHTSYHVDRAGFISQLKTYSRWLEPGRSL